MQVVANLERYSQFAGFKRIALQAVAFTLSRQDILGLEREFESMDADHDGFITIQEFRDALQSSGHLSNTEISNIFEAMDVDHKGKIHLNEFVAAAIDTKYYKSESAIHEAFSRHVECSRCTSP